MEFRLAAEGNVDELRQWLRSHPERVNVPAPGSNLTLLYTTISNANRTDLASLQAGHSRYLNTVRMLCEEYKADVMAPNGGSYNNALHIAAQIGATDIVRYLVDVLHAPVDRTNVFGERPAQMAERGGHAECVALLQRTPSLTAARVSVTSANAAANASGNPSRFHSVTVSDSDSDDNADGGSSTGTGPRWQTSNAMGNGGGGGGGMQSGPVAMVPLPLYANPNISPANAAEGPPATQLPAQRGSFLSSGGGGGDPRLPSQPSPQSTPIGQYSALRAESNTSIGTGELPDSTATPPLPRPVRPRKEYDITKSRILANPDLQGMRSAFGDGFKYVQCSDHYEIRGILPYTYRGAVYYTPVIISVYAPASSADCASSPATVAGQADGAGSSASDPSSPLGTAGSQRSGLGAESGAGGPVEVYCRYRVCLNMQQLNDFAVSRKAEYLDPISGAIIPSPGDDKYVSLTAYIRNVVVRNFEAVPPLIVPTSSYAFPLQPNVSQLGAAHSADPYRHHHSLNAPAFMKNALPSRTAAHIRCATILRALSKFGDGLGRYFPQTHRIVVYVPVFSEHKAAVLAMPQERTYTTTVDQSSAPVSPATAGGNNGGGSKKAVSQQVAVEAVAELQVRVLMQFNPTGAAGAAATDASVDGREGGVYAYPPRVYLIDAAAHPPAFLTGSSQPTPGSLTGACFAAILRDADTGEVEPERLKLSQEAWSASGSVYDVLVGLQRLLRDTVEAYAISYTGRRPDSSPVQQANATADAYGRGFTSGVSAGGNASRSPAAASALDTFFTSPTSASHPAVSGMGSGGGGEVQNGGGQPSPPGNGGGRCLYCFQPLQSRALLQPCGHDGMCGLCVQRLQSHCREEIIACPVCRGKVRSVMEVFL